MQYVHVGIHVKHLE
ncbi:Protein of unknown function [Bacillus cytotoxicus]|uniref:Uncharacterized protein n=1 Tax=Bacillus cytotoxicus TaxID=580165 RepID=A0AAX2CIC3_9BACI|nr:Protein of unknown function [Bacillus cytotoxicus]SCN38051.1 Protein of unknown function [Bacillus cytotoxicus]